MSTLNSVENGWNGQLRKRLILKYMHTKKLDDIKSVCKNAGMEGFEVSRQLNHIKAGKIKNDHIIFLNRNELALIRDVSIVSDSLDNARKWLLLGCMIGQRAGDLLSLSKQNIVTRDNLEVIEIKQQKTGKLVMIPILDETEKLLSTGLPYPISTQKFNYHIKKVCKQAGIDEPTVGKKYDKGIGRKVSGTFPKHELITSHVCRRSFATNLYGELPTPLIIQITGHSTEKMLQRYIGKAPIDYAQQIANYYENQKQLKTRDAKI